MTSRQSYEHEMIIHIGPVHTSKYKRTERIPNIFSFRLDKKKQHKVEVPKSGIQKERKKLLITPDMIIKNLVYPPSVASENLGISVSTLRRRFAEFNCGQAWPTSELHNFDKNIDQKNKGSLWAVVNDSPKDCCVVDNLTEVILACAFRAHSK
jgi:hypothetical protein